MKQERQLTRKAHPFCRLSSHESYYPPLAAVGFRAVEEILASDQHKKINRDDWYLVLLYTL
jgi:hypothetical protein